MWIQYVSTTVGKWIKLEILCVFLCAKKFVFIPHCTRTRTIKRMINKSSQWHCRKSLGPAISLVIFIYLSLYRSRSRAVLNTP